MSPEMTDFFFIYFPPPLSQEIWLIAQLVLLTERKSPLIFIPGESSEEQLPGC